MILAVRELVVGGRQIFASAVLSPSISPWTQLIHVVFLRRRGAQSAEHQAAGFSEGASHAVAF